jgi:hypothetical protein
MIERHIIIDNVDPVTFYGVNNSNIQLIRNLFPKLRMAARGSVITVIGDDSETADFEQKVHALADYCATYNTLPEDVIIDTIKGTPPKQLKMDDVILYGVNGKPISGRTPNQQLLIGRAAADGLAVHAIDDNVVHLQLLGWSTLDGVDDDVLGQRVVGSAVVGQLVNLLFKVGRLGIVTDHSDDAATRCHAQFWEQVADELYVTVVHPVEGHGIHVVNDNVPFNHSIS